MELLPCYDFTFERWRAGNLSEFGIETRYYSIIENKRIIRKYAIGYLPGNQLWVRPKINTVAIMFWNKYYFWTHVTLKEFKACFPSLKI
jgi:hypothetical protein